MLVLDYHKAISYNHHAWQKTQRRLGLLHDSAGSGNPIFSGLESINVILTNELFAIKGIYATISENRETLQGEDLSYVIIEVNEILKIINEIKGEVEVAIEKGITKKEQAIVETDIILAEAIEMWYTVLRLLKRLNRKTVRHTSQLAKDIAAQSLRTIEKVYGH